MGNVIAYEVSFFGLSLDVGSSPLSAVAAVAVLIGYLIASIDGATIGFVGIRDAITNFRDGAGATPNSVTRVVSTLAAVVLFFTGGAFVIGISAWLCGASSFIRRGKAASKEDENTELASA